MTAPLTSSGRPAKAASPITSSRNDGLALPRRLHIKFSAAVQRIADRDGIELTPSRASRMM
jgi:hypothetical protein